MLGFHSISEFSISEIAAAAVVVPPTPPGVDVGVGSTFDQFGQLTEQRRKRLKREDEEMQIIITAMGVIETRRLNRYN